MYTKIIKFLKKIVRENKDSFSEMRLYNKAISLWDDIENLNLSSLEKRKFSKKLKEENLEDIPEYNCEETAISSLHDFVMTNYYY